MIDRFELIIDSTHRINWPDGGSFQPIEVRINGKDLIELIRNVELDDASKEYDERIAAGETESDIGKRGALAGNYIYLPAGLVFLPSQNYLGNPFRHGFLIPEDDPRNRKSLILQCTCGVTECWFLLATITVTNDFVVWSDFCQFHRNWHYNCGPFVFTRREYEAQLTPPNKAVNPSGGSDVL